MNQTWHLTCEISTNLYLNSSEHITETQYPHPAIKSIEIKPKINEKGEPICGVFSFDIVYEIDIKDDNENFIIVDTGKDILNYYIDKITFYTGQRAKITNGLSYKYDYPGTRRCKIISLDEYGFFGPPIPLSSELLVPWNNQKIERIIAWYRKGIEERDIISSATCLFASLELLAEQFECIEKSNKRCKNCGHVYDDKPGSNMKVRNLVVNILGYNIQISKNLWDMRCLLSHGGIDLTSKKYHDIHLIRNDLIQIINNGIKKLLDIPIDRFPTEAQYQEQFIEPILVCEYTLP